MPIDIIQQYPTWELTPEQFRDECIWCAGFWDGEGCTRKCHRKGQRNPTLQMEIGQSVHKHNPSEDVPEVLVIFKNVVKVGTLFLHPKDKSGYKNAKSHKRTFWRWRCAGYDCVKVAELLYPYWKSEKRTQYDRCFLACMPKRENIVNQLMCKRGHIRNTENGYYNSDGYYNCRKCERILYISR